MPFWDERFRAVGEIYPDVATEQYHIDILTAHFVRRPASFDVVVASNLFGDILSDLGPGGDRHDRHRAVGQPQPGAALSLDVRAGARLGARHRRQEHRQSDRPDLVGRDDARASRRQACRGRASSRRSSACWHPAKTSPATWAAPRRPAALGAAIADAVSVHPSGRAAASWLNCAFVDTHFHLHDMKHPTLRYGWLEPDAVHGFLPDTDPLKSQHYFIKDYIAEIRFANVPKAIHVQAAVNTPDPVDETRLAAGIRRQDRLSAGHRRRVPSGAARRSGGARPAHAVCQRARRPQFRRRRLSRRSGLAPRLRRTRRRAISSPASIPVSSLRPTSPTWRRTFPDTIICVDHCAIPMARDEAYFQTWREAMDVMASAPNVVMKISGLGMCDPLWTVELDPAVCASAASRPSASIASSSAPTGRSTACSAPIPDVINAYAEIISGFSRDEQIRMFSGNAERIFRI